MNRLINAFVPGQDPIVEIDDGKGKTLRGKITQSWIQFLQDILDAIGQSPSLFGSAGVTGQSAAIANTPLNDDTLTEGLYRVSYHARVTQAATTSSSLEVIVSFTSGGGAQSKTGTAITGNTITSWESQTWLIYVDDASGVSYSTNYTSVGATAMNYEVYVVLEKVRA